jgi:hypothetical protein
MICSQHKLRFRERTKEFFFPLGNTKVGQRIIESTFEYFKLLNLLVESGRLEKMVKVGLEVVITFGISL